MLMTVLVILLVLFLVGGIAGNGRWGAAGWSPLGIVVVLLIVLWLSGNLHGWR